MVTILGNSSIQNSAHDERLAAFKDILVSWLGPVVLFIMIPFAIYLGNQGEFNYDLSVMAPFFLLLGVTTVLSLLLYYVKPRWRMRIALLSFYLGIYFLLADIVTPGPGVLLDGRQFEASGPWYNSLIQFCIILILLLLGTKLPINLQRSVAALVVGVICVTQAITIVFKLQPETVWGIDRNASSGAHSQSGLAHPGTNKPNIYHIILDGYSSYGFSEEISKPNVAQIFEGFTFFERNRSNYFVTMCCLPSLLSGTLYQGGSFKKWQEAASESGIFEELRKEGYLITVYTAGRKEKLYRNADFARTSYDIAEKQIGNTDRLALLQIWLVRISPNFLKDRVREISNRMQRMITVMSVPLIREFISNEQSRTSHGNYVFCHFLIPHTPYVWDEDCNFSPATSYAAQVSCTTKLLNDFFDSLKKLNRYEESVIIIQGDHGWFDVGPHSANSMGDSPDIRATLMQYRYCKPEEYLNLAHSLLLVKPPFPKQRQLQISEAPTQAIDVSATIFSLIGLDIRKAQGQSVFTLNPAEPREIHHFVGFYDKDDNGQVLAVGSNLFSRKIGHFSFTNGVGWKIYPNLDLVY